MQPRPDFTTTTDTLHVLLVEDRAEDAELVLYELRHNGFTVHATRVDNEPDYVARLNDDLDLILADYTLPQFDALRALQHLLNRGLTIPFIVVTGTVSEEVAVECIKRGAADYLIKDRLTRLGPAVRHALAEHQLREEKKRADEALRRHAEELEHIVAARTLELRRAKEHVEGILNTTGDGIVFLRADGTIRQTNPAFNRLFDYAPDVLIHKPFALLAPETHQADVEAALQHVTSTDTTAHLEMPMRRRDGTRFDADLILDNTGSAGSEGGIVGSIRDVSERKAMERALQASEARYRRLAENAQDTIYRLALSPSVRFEYVSSAVSTLLGYSPDEFYANPELLLDLIEPLDRPLLLRLTQHADDQNRPLVLRWRRRDSTTVWAEHRDVPIYDASGNIIAVEGIARDITQRHRVEAELRKALQVERELNELKTRFTSMVSHEFRTPLAIIQSAGDLLKLYGDRMTPERRHEQLDEIQLQVRHLVALLDDILAISRADTRGFDVVFKRINMAAMCAELTRDIQHMAPLYQIQYEATGDSCVGWVDETLLRRAVGNLLSNAVKYSTEGSTVWLELSCDPNWTTFRVRDQGIGIPPDERDRLFEPFHRAGNVGRLPGTGLGLAIVKQAADAHGGRIDYESELDVGTTFVLRIPYRRENDST